MGIRDRGSTTIVADQFGNASLLCVGTPGMAKGGSGDVLTGVIGGLLAQGKDCLLYTSEIWLVRAGKGQKLARIRSRDGIDEIHAENRLKSQAGEEELLARADVVLTNDGTLEQLRKQIGEYFYGKSGN